MRALRPLVLATLLALPLWAQQTPTFEVRPAASEIRVDGVLDEPAWSTATVIPVRYEWFPGDNVEPPVKTEALVTFDSRNIYVAFRAFDPRPSEIRAHLMDRDSITTFVQDDHILVMIDTFNDQRRAFQFRVNPLGVQADAIFSQIEGIEDFSWDIIWASAGRITDEGYIVELALPLNQLRFPQTGDVQTWGFELGRSYPRSVRHRISANPRNRNETCILCQINKVTGFQRLQAGRNVELDPTLTATQSDQAAFPARELQRGEQKIEPGLTARWGITPAMTLNAAINPDFSQVEADAAQLAENERFALFFEEKRPFFLEGIDFFSTPITAVFTRTVADPAWGLKLSGKQGQNAMGVFVTQDERNNILIPANEGSRFAFLEDDVTAGVLRYRRDFGSSSTVGVLYAGREGDGYHNRVAGIDAFFQVTPADEVRVQYLRTDTRYPQELAADFGQPSDSFAGNGLRVSYFRVSRNWIWGGDYRDLDPGFRADSGFVPRVDLRQLEAVLTRRMWGDPKDWYTNMQFGVTAQRSEDHEGNLSDQTAALVFVVGGRRQSLFQARLAENTIRVGDRLHEGLLSALTYFEMQPGPIGKISMLLEFGETVDFANNQPADRLLIIPAVELKLGRHVNAQARRIQQWLDVAAGRLSETAIDELRLVYNFNVRSFVRAIVQHQEIERDPALFQFPVQARTETLFSQLLFSYKVNPQTVLFIGYSDNHLGLGPFDLRQTGRTFFAKLGYAWIF